MPATTFTKTFHMDTYPAISPTRPELSCEGKTVIITGGGTGIGATTAMSFAEAGATKIALVGRTEATLLATKAQIESAWPAVTVYIAVADVSDAESLGLASHNIRITLGAWDIFVHNAGVLGDVRRLMAADLDEWWSVFEINTKSIAIFAKHFLTKCRLPGATFISVNSEAAHVPAEYLPPCSAYSVSKFAAARLTEFLAHENPGLRVFTVNPGLIRTAMAEKFLEAANVSPDQKIFSTAKLAADFFVWCVSSEAEFVRGRFLWANWDIEEMQQRRRELEDPALLRMSQLWMGP